MSGRIGMIHLTGEDSIGFVNAFFFPSEEEVLIRENIRRRRTERIEIEDTEDGFTAEINDLDLAFLEDDWILCYS